ncbi:hypothetical protein Moror_17095 [Moniliophthora roreri MCA 2997]|uniref:Uncharacterized protein n=1 Tax=Moniliophthora roreri (strain MCA 2997) TaxID=1381753 RepID=V2X4S6_MONRO|nr:hypothetical protein Moror_17095 [Moniliophthora roreri MCA 2997]
MAEKLAIPELLFVTASTQLLLYGCNVVLFAVSLFLLQRRNGMKGNVYHKMMAILLFILITVEAVLNTLQAMVELRMTTSGGSVKGVDLVACNLVNLVTLQLVVMTSFAILANRCYHIWNRSYKVIALPSLMVFSETIIFYSLQVPAYARVSHDFTKGTDFAEYNQTLENQKPADIAAAILSMLADTFLTVLIASRIWWTTRQVQKFRRRRATQQKYDCIVAIIIWVDGQAVPIFAALLPQVYALAPLLIMVRVGLGLTADTEEFTTLRAGVSHEIEFQATVPTGLDRENFLDTNASSSGDRTADSDVQGESSTKIGYAL